MNAPWPYSKPVQLSDRESRPRWTCPEGTCECHPVLQPQRERHRHRIALFDENAERMGGARCRVWQAGRLLNTQTPYADGEGWIAVELDGAPRQLLVEWAPADTPVEPMLPFRITYHIALGDDLEDQVARRLHNIGFCLAPTLSQNVSAFQHVYGPPGSDVTGRPEDIDAQLRIYHDAALLPPVTEPHSSTPVASPVVQAQGCARESRITEPFAIGVEVGDHVPWNESDDIVVADAAGEQVLRRSIGSGEPEDALFIIRFADYEKGERYTVKVRFGAYAFLMYQGLDIYDALNPATENRPPVPPQRVLIEDDS